MRLVCPACGAVASLEAWMAEPNWRRAQEVVGQIPHPVVERASGYVALFRPLPPADGKPGRGLSSARVLALYTELRDLVAAGHVTWERMAARPCPPRIWAEAIDLVTGRADLRRPLNSHNYLRRIAYDLADKADRAAETAHNRAERSGQVSTREDAEDMNRLAPEQVREMCRDIGRRLRGMRA